MIQLTFLEWETVAIQNKKRDSKNANALFKEDFETLIKHQDKFKKYYTLSNKKIIFRNYVGLFRVGNLSISIIPKIITYKENEENKSKELKNLSTFFNQFFKYTKNKKAIKTDSNNLNKSYDSILDIFIEQFANEVGEIVQMGLRKGYIFENENRQNFKGKILFLENIKSNHSNKGKLFCRYQEYSEKIFINYVLLEALKKCLKMTLSPILKDYIKKIINAFPSENFKFKISKDKVDKIIINQNNLKYKNSLELAKMFIFNESPIFNHGSHALISFMFDMNKLWEEFVFRIFQDACRSDPNYNYRVLFQRKKKFWREENSPKNESSIKSDILLTKKYKEKFNPKETILIETKWKNNDGKEIKRPEPNDLKQVFVYKNYFGLKKSFLLFPTNEEKVKNIKAFFEKPSSIGGDSFDLECSLIYLPLSFSQNFQAFKNSLIKHLTENILTPENPN
jgi:5-methylcytosine-specific restriction enzyme subunit McrC